MNNCNQTKIGNWIVQTTEITKKIREIKNNIEYLIKRS